MAALSPMTWNWNWKLVVTGVAALTGVLGLGAPLELSGPPSHPQAIDDRRTAAQITAVSALEEETRRLDERLANTAVAAPSRNLFRFGERPAAARRAVAPTHVVAPAPIVAAPAPFPLRLTGIAVDIVDGVAKRTAIVSGPSGLELATSGQAAAPGYRVVEVGESFTEVERTSDGVRQRLTLRP
jgi:hypothetical protein